MGESFSARNAEDVVVPRLLIVDDEKYIVDLLKRIAGPAWATTAMTNAAMALELLREGNRFDCILCDLTMPSMHGSVFYDAVCAIDEAQSGRIVFMTGGRGLADVDEFLGTVPNRCLGKPFGANDVRSVLSVLHPDAAWASSGVWRRHDG